ncbi:MAG TPA: hypothetical protein VGQ33_00120, partial [Vicinamibacteria bacterium]|nr:hypothetical protein [Vicinamibacteria bacterium]
MRPPAKATLALAFLLAGVSAFADDVVWLRNGDRLTGEVVSETKGSIRLKLPFASLLIPKSRIERLLRADGKEEVLHAPEAGASPAPPAAPTVPSARLVIVVTGASFWQAWDPKDAPADKSLRLEVRIDETAVASWTDAHLDPEDLPGAVVNTFALVSGDAAAGAASGVVLGTPQIQRGRVALPIGVPGAVGEDRHLRIAYEVNDGTAASPSWRDVVSAALTVTLRADPPTVIQLRQDRGHMEFA